jgi:Na+-translocating ferredoxin:NAD+ oxidoreductase subunit G
MSAPASPMPMPAQVPSWRLLATLGVAGAVAGLALAVVHSATAPRIEAHRAAALQAAIEEVLHSPARFDTLYLVSGELVRTPPAGVKPHSGERVFRGYTGSGSVAGYAITASEAGFADQIGLIFGYDPATQSVLGMKVLSSKETPGLGDKIEKDSSFVRQFRGAVAPLVGVKDAASRTDRNAVATITGATISARTVIKTINNAVAYWEPYLNANTRTATTGVGR